MQGRFVGFVSSWGVCTGAMLHVLAAAFGFSLIIQGSPVVYAAFKYVGAAYLLYMGVKQFKYNSITIAKAGGELESPRLKRVFL